MFFSLLERGGLMCWAFKLLFFYSQSVPKGFPENSQMVPNVISNIFLIGSSVTTLIMLTLPKVALLKVKTFI
jgi:hypothetical protein